jgi:hypothetical protein
MRYSRIGDITTDRTLAVTSLVNLERLRSGSNATGARPVEATTGQPDQPVLKQLADGVESMTRRVRHVMLNDVHQALLTRDRWRHTGKGPPTSSMSMSAGSSGRRRPRPVRSAERRKPLLHRRVEHFARSARGVSHSPKVAGSDPAPLRREPLAFLHVPRSSSRSGVGRFWSWPQFTASRQDGRLIRCRI